MKRTWFALLFFLCCAGSALAAPGADVTGRIGDIRSVKLFRNGDQSAFPILTLGRIEPLELHFDDLDGDVKNYYYSFQLCNADWTPSILHPFEYTQGFQNVRIINYRLSSIASTRYTHYQAAVPDRNAVPTRSGNYLLKVYLNGDTAQLAFTTRFVVADTKANIAAVVQEPFNARYFRTYQKLNIGVKTGNRMTNFSPQDLKVVVLQNYNWRTAQVMDRPTLFRGDYYEYSDESITAMPAGMEWRWLDLRSLRLMSDRVDRINTRTDTTQVYVKHDVPRNGQIRVYYRDLNGRYSIETMESINPFWQGEYGTVHFTFVPPGGKAFEGQDVYVFGELTNYSENAEGLMTYNAEQGVYEASLLLKQGFYNYNYITLPRGKPGYPDLSQTEGNNWATENNYTILVYFRPFGARADELVGATQVSSQFGQQR